MESPTRLQKAPAYRFIAFLLMLLPYILTYGGIQIIASFGTEIMESFSVEEGNLSLLSSLGTFAKAVIALAAGGFMARFGGKKIVLFGLGTMALSGLLYLIPTESFALLCLFRLVQGVGAGITSACLMSLVCAWFPRHERATAQGVMICFFGVSISIVTVYAFVCRNAGFAWNFSTALWLFVGSAVLFLLIAFFYHDIRAKYGVNSIDEALGTEEESGTTDGKDHAAKPSNWGEALRSPAFWISSMALFFYGACSYGVGFVMPLFFRYCGFDGAEATSIMSIGTLSSAIFALLGGVISDRVFHSRRSEVTSISYGGAVILFVVTALVGRSASAAMLTVVYFLAYGMMNLCAGPAWCLPAEVVAPSFASQNMGSSVMFSGIGGFVMMNVIGLVIEHGNALIGLLLLIGCMLLVTLGGLALRRGYRA